MARFVGERRFVGLFTSNAYSAQPRTIPMLRRKIEAVMAHAGLRPTSHDGKALTHILDTFPRDELFQVSADELYEISTGILHMGGLPRLKLFLRFDRFDRFVSALLLAPRDHINAKLRTDIHALLAKAFNGRMSAFDAALGRQRRWSGCITSSAAMRARCPRSMCASWNGTSPS